MEVCYSGLLKALRYSPLPKKWHLARLSTIINIENY